MGTKPTASIYRRMSAASTDDKTGLTTQDADLHALAERHGLEVIAVHTDDGQSGALRNRPGFLAWLADAREGRATHLLAWKLDRVSRGSLQGLARFLDVLDGVDADGERTHAPVRFLSAADGLDSKAPGWDLQVAVLGALAKAEREVIRGRILAHRATARAEGRAVGGRRGWAFQKSPRPGGGHRLTPVPAHADAVRWALDHLRAGGTIRGIAREWEARGLKPKDGGVWHVPPVRRILQNPNLYGATTYNGDVIRNADGTARVDAEQAILSLTEWAELQRLLKARSTSRVKPDRPRPALLAGLLICGSCMRVMYPHRPANKVWTYRCRGGECPAPTSILLAETDAYLEAEFLRLMAHAAYDPFAWMPPRAEVDPEEVARIEEALAAVERLLASDLSDDEALTAIRQRRDLRERLAAAQDLSAVDEEAPGWNTFDERTYAEVYRQTESVPERTKLLALAFPRVWVIPGERGGRDRVFDPERLLW